MPTRCTICPGRPPILGPDEMVTLVCNGGHRVEAPPSMVGQACWVCGMAWRLPDAVDERIRRYEAGRVAG